MGYQTSDQADLWYRVVRSGGARWDKALHTSTFVTTSSLDNMGNPVQILTGGACSKTETKTKALTIIDGSWTHVAAEDAWLEVTTLAEDVAKKVPEMVLTSSTRTKVLANKLIAAH